MRKNWLLLALLMLTFSACTKNEEPSSEGGTPLPHHIDPVYQVGDYFHNDTLEGIVFHTIAGGLNGLMVSLDETQLPWCKTNYVNSLTGATNPYDGWRNTNILMSNYDLNHYPAIRWSHKKNTWHLVHQNHPVTNRQWYVPSSDELRYLLLNQEAVNATLSAMGRPTMEGKTYWSSTEMGTRSAAALHMQDSSIVISESLKDQIFYVRAIRNF